MRQQRRAAQRPLPPQQPAPRLRQRLRQRRRQPLPAGTAAPPAPRAPPLPLRPGRRRWRQRRPPPPRCPQQQAPRRPRCRGTRGVEGQVARLELAVGSRLGEERRRGGTILPRCAQALAPPLLRLLSGWATAAAAAAAGRLVLPGGPASDPAAVPPLPLPLPLTTTTTCVRRCRPSPAHQLGQRGGGGRRGKGLVPGAGQGGDGAVDGQGAVVARLPGGGTVRKNGDAGSRGCEAARCG
mgnify:CR=1 FL=1